MLIKSFSDDWKWWVWNYVKAEKNKENLFVILLNHGFEWEAISKELNFIPSSPKTLERKERQKIIDNNDPCFVNPLYKTLADNPAVHRFESNFLEMYEIDDFLNEKECQEFVDKIGSSLHKSTVTNPEANKSVRTSSTAYLRAHEWENSRLLNEKVHSIMRWPMLAGEELQGQRYNVGEEFKQHCDFFDKNSPYNVVHLEKGQRTWTFMIYLDDVESGGETKFTKINFEFKPKRGKAIIWNNLLPNGNGNAWSEHWGMPVQSGQKNIITKWFREQNPAKQ
jgi:prolyl 4-hydroxylase